MPDGSDSSEIRFGGTMADIPADGWNACAGQAHAHHNPFIAHGFLSALEDAGCITDDAGWRAVHLGLYGAHGEMDGCCPLYLKGHSQGEYVFDHTIADAYTRAGGQYYPKLLCAVPFTPANGPRLCVRDGAPPGTRETLAESLKTVCAKLELSGAHVNFIQPQDREALTKAGFLIRTGMQFHWFNRDYNSYDDFLGDLASRKRKTLKRERREVVGAGITIERLYGQDIREHHWDAMYQFYIDTGSRKWGRPYLNREFFSLLGERMGEQVALVLAHRDGRPIAGALNLLGGDAIYGRYWGCVEDVPFLHFELCYHQAIDIAIERKLARVEAGAQGEHKIARGYLPVRTYSAHWISDEKFHEAVADFFVREQQGMAFEQRELMDDAPYRREIRDALAATFLD